MEEVKNLSAGLEIAIRRITTGRFPILVVVAGGSCSGKTFFSRLLVKRLKMEGIESSTIPLDYYFKDLDDPTLPRTEDGRRLFDSPESYRSAVYIGDVRRLFIERLPVSLPRYNMETNRFLDSLGNFVLPRGVIVAEGLFAISFLKDLLGAIKIFIDADTGKRIERRVERDVSRYGVSEERVREILARKVLPCHRNFVEPQKENAELVIKNNKEANNG